MGTGIGASSVESEELDTEKVLARLNATGNRKGKLALVGDELVNSPNIVGKTVVVDLQLLEARDGRLSGVGNFGAVIPSSN